MEDRTFAACMLIQAVCMVIILVCMVIIASYRASGRPMKKTVAVQGKTATASGGRTPVPNITRRKQPYVI